MIFMGNRLQVTFFVREGVNLEARTRESKDSFLVRSDLTTWDTTCFTAIIENSINVPDISGWQTEQVARSGTEGANKAVLGLGANTTLTLGRGSFARAKRVSSPAMSAEEKT